MSRDDLIGLVLILGYMVGTPLAIFLAATS